MVSEEHEEGKEAQRVTVVAFVDCLGFFFVSQNARERERQREGEIEEIRLVLLHPLSLDKYVFDMSETDVSIFFRVFFLL